MSQTHWSLHAQTSSPNGYFCVFKHMSYDNIFNLFTTKKSICLKNTFF